MAGEQRSRVVQRMLETLGTMDYNAVADMLLDRNPKASVTKIEADIMAYPNLGAEIERADVVNRLVVDFLREGQT